jgi:hypothetical protein
MCAIRGESRNAGDRRHLEPVQSTEEAAYPVARGAVNPIGSTRFFKFGPTQLTGWHSINAFPENFFVRQLRVRHFECEVNDDDRSLPCHNCGVP